MWCTPLRWMTRRPHHKRSWLTQPATMPSADFKAVQPTRRGMAAVTPSCLPWLSTPTRPVNGCAVLAASAVTQLQTAMLPAAEACLMSCETCVGLWPVGLPMSFPTLALAVTSVVGTAAAVIVAVVILAAVIVVGVIAVAATAICFEQCPHERLLATVFWAQPCCLCMCLFHHVGTYKLHQCIRIVDLQNRERGKESTDL